MQCYLLKCSVTNKCTHNITPAQGLDSIDVTTKTIIQYTCDQQVQLIHIKSTNITLLLTLCGYIIDIYNVLHIHYQQELNLSNVNLLFYSNVILTLPSNYRRCYVYKEGPTYWNSPLGHLSIMGIFILFLFMLLFTELHFIHYFYTKKVV